MLGPYYLNLIAHASGDRSQGQSRKIQQIDAVSNETCLASIDKHQVAPTYAVKVSRGFNYQKLDRKQLQELRGERTFLVSTHDPARVEPLATGRFALA